MFAGEYLVLECLKIFSLEIVKNKYPLFSAHKQDFSCNCLTLTKSVSDLNGNDVCVPLLLKSPLRTEAVDAGYSSDLQSAKLPGRDLS